MNSSEHSNSTSTTTDELVSTHLIGEAAFAIECDQLSGPFLMQLITSSDLWAFIGSNGAITAGRKNPDHALFPYYTQDKLFDMKATSGSFTAIRWKDASSGSQRVWIPFSEIPEGSDLISRRVIKSFSGSKIAIEETHGLLNLTVRILWTSSNTLGILRQTSLVSKNPDSVDLDIVDGIINVMPASIDQQFQNEFSILADAYKRCEWYEPGLGTYSLSSVPTDKAEPSESLRATTVWSQGFPGNGHLLSMSQLGNFYKGMELEDEFEIRGKRGAYLRHASISVQSGESQSWWTVADLDQSGAKVMASIAMLEGQKVDTQSIISSMQKDCDKIVTMLSQADGIQVSAQPKTTARHFSNALFNLMRGGTFPLGYKIPTHDLKRHIKLCNRQSYEKHKTRLDELPEYIELQSLKQTLDVFAGPELTRIAEEYLPLTFSRRHGDPSRPWNRFSIDITDENEQPIYAYQGNWRDIFQNWEALLHTFPLYTDAVISRFLNASTADGYNPYRVTKTGFEWEREEPDSPWSNIGYWGDHQIIYLLKLLEFSFKTNPTHLSGLLNKARYAFADVPYRIKPFSDILENARASIVYDHQHSDRIDQRAATKGSDGQLLHDSSGTIIHATLIEKLMVPLLAKLSNFVPGAGIWMNTQRPEWNDANNALAGYGASVVTLGYIHRYLEFLERLLSISSESTYQFHKATVELMRQIHQILKDAPAARDMDDQQRAAVVYALGEAGTRYRECCYQGDFAAETVNLSADSIRDAIACFRTSARDSLQSNRRPDALYHSYNLVDLNTQGKVAVKNLGLMLEGQVSILSSGILDIGEALELVRALRLSELYREDQNSYLLYPNRNLPIFIDKGAIPEDLLEKYPEVSQHFSARHGSIAQRDSDGRVRFHPSFRNAEYLNAALAKLKLSEDENKKIREIYEGTFNHHAFTGRSGTFFGYEGLGSIYWHMVSKLLLAVQEVILQNPEPTPEREALQEAYFEIRKGIGVDKSPKEYGAFPIDAYSHTPAHAGAQQPGMTGQVKEDLLVRFGELGITLEKGCICFEPKLLKLEEFTTEKTELIHCKSDSEMASIEVPEASVAFTLCHTPVIYQLADDANSLSCSICYVDREENLPEAKLNADLSAQIFSRTSGIKLIRVSIPKHHLIQFD